MSARPAKQCEAARLRRKQAQLRMHTHGHTGSILAEESHERFACYRRARRLKSSLIEELVNGLGVLCVRCVRHGSWWASRKGREGRRGSARGYFGFNCGKRMTSRM